MSQSERLLTAGEAAEYLGCTERMVRKLTWTNQLPFVNIGRLVRYRLADVLAFVERNRKGGD